MSVLSGVMNAPTMTPADAAAIMGVSDRTIRRWLKLSTEGVDYVRTPGGRIRIAHTCVASWAQPKQVAA